MQVLPVQRIFIAHNQKQPKKPIVKCTSCGSKIGESEKRYKIPNGIICDRNKCLLGASVKEFHMSRR